MTRGKDSDLDLVEKNVDVGLGRGEVVELPDFKTQEDRDRVFDYLASTGKYDLRKGTTIPKQGLSPMDGFYVLHVIRRRA